MLLAIDTATRKIGIALYDGVQVLHEAVWNTPFRHTVELIPAIDQALAGANLKVTDLDVIALTIGPGSYTGLRIGAAVAKGLALSRRLDLVAVSTFEVLSAAFPADEALRMAVVIEAGRSRLGVGWFEVQEGAWQPSEEAELLTAEELSKKIRVPTLICGELDYELRKLLGRKHKNVVLATPAQSLRRPAYLAELAWARWQAGERSDPETVAPVYLQTNENIPG
ncbi:MAG TPA: tRNA (adenosine(37)-N6)-threonylcarbamoyltransferase complex dimerization subunit type 1 TsaB [Chloroflexi bacterium]|nr:tRNA (adenosine(37)-N6)-threonylcarbamoyltransferase complex dimerization subunit type 1 TsaB [Chloroflexota bacterium]